MANTVTLTTLFDGSKIFVGKVDIAGDGVSGDETATVIVNASTASPAFVASNIQKIWSSLSGFSATLLWDATANVVAYNLPQDVAEDIDFEEIGGLTNQGGAGVTGNILVTTSGLGAGDHGSIILRMYKN